MVKGASVQIGNGVVDVLSGGSASVAFQSGGSGGLEIADAAGKASAFTGTVSGFGVNAGGTAHADPAEYIDLVNVLSGAITLNYSSGGSGNTSGTLTVSSGGTLVASIHMLGSYSAGDFQISSGSGGTVEITDPGVVGGGVQSANIALFGSYIAGSFVTAAGEQGGTVISEAAQPANQQPMLTHPHV